MESDESDQIQRMSSWPDSSLGGKATLSDCNGVNVDAIKPDFDFCEQQTRKSACASKQTDQRLFIRSLERPVRPVKAA